MFSIFTALITLVRAIFLLLVGVSVSLVVLSPITLANQRPADPFLSYTDLLLAEPPDDFVQRGFDCQAGIAPNFGWGCIVRPPVGKFSEIGVNISYNDSHKRLLTFRPRPNSVIIGDLILLWGKPNVRIDSDSTYFNWPNADSRAIVITGRRHYSYFQSVSYVAITYQIPA